MILKYVSLSTIQSKKQLLSWFYPSLVTNEKVKLSNKDSKLVSMCKKNSNISEMIDTLDLMEI